MSKRNTKDTPVKPAPKQALTLKEVRLRRRKKEKETLSIVTNVERVDSYAVPRKISGEQLQDKFKAQRDEYVEAITNLVASQMAMTTAVNNVLEATREANPDTAAADSLYESIDSAWDLATSALFLESAFVSSGYDKDAARTLAQSILLKRTEVAHSTATPPVAAKKNEKPQNMEDIVEAVRNDLNRMGLKISKSAPAKPDVPNSRKRKQAE